MTRMQRPRQTQRNKTSHDLRLPSNARMHVILIPGFAGFDALGQLEYYAGVTPFFRKWCKKHTDRATAVLHYFDNFPTAAVVTRSELLSQYLVKRIARAEIAGEDRIALVGHSTGGLDIRLLLWHLAQLSQLSKPIVTDGGSGKDRAVKVDPGEVLERVDRVVFISVPQWGTNIADWVRTYHPERRLVVAGLRASVEASQVPLVDTAQHLISSVTAALANTDLIFAVQDALREAEADTRRSPLGTAKAQEAAALISLWLRHMATDFRAIDDLTAVEPRRHAKGSEDWERSPAHFDSKRRKEEQRIWKEHDIRTKSYATIGTNPFNFSDDPVPRWDLLKPWTYPEFNKETKRSARTDATYRICYRACAGGPFKYPPDSEGLGLEALHSEKERKIAMWDNDGIVNTASMLWPNLEKTVLVESDHMDIVGHYQRVRAANGSGREFQAYDLLKSNSGFTSDIFEDVWAAIFDFCVPKRR